MVLRAGGEALKRSEQIFPVQFPCQVCRRQQKKTELLIIIFAAYKAERNSERVLPSCPNSPEPTAVGTEAFGKVSASVPVSDRLSDIQPWLDQNPGSQRTRRSFVKFCPLMGLTVAPDPIWLYSHFICVHVFPQPQHHRMTFSNQSSTRTEKC